MSVPRLEMRRTGPDKHATSGVAGHSFILNSMDIDDLKVGMVVRCKEGILLHVSTSSEILLMRKSVVKQSNGAYNFQENGKLMVYLGVRTDEDVGKYTWASLMFLIEGTVKYTSPISVEYLEPAFDHYDHQN